MIQGSQLGADFISVGDTEIGVEGERFAPVLAGPVGVATGLVGEAVMSTRLLVAVADLGGQGERDGVVYACLANADFRAEGSTQPRCLVK